MTHQLTPLKTHHLLLITGSLDAEESLLIKPDLELFIDEGKGEGGLYGYLNM